MKRLLVWVILGVALFVSSRLQAQSIVTSTAVTFCVEYQDHTTDVRTLIDESVLGTDSAQEIQVHERKHRDQYKALIAQTNACPDLSDPMVKLSLEVQAYCAARPYRMKRGISEFETDQVYLEKLRYQFYGKLPTPIIVLTYHQQCS